MPCYVRGRGCLRKGGACAEVPRCTRSKWLARRRVLGHHTQPVPLLGCQPLTPSSANILSLRFLHACTEEVFFQKILYASLKCDFYKVA